MMTRMPAMLAWLYFMASAAGQGSVRLRAADLLPKDSRIIETANVPLRGAKARVLVLWMSAPRKVISTWDSAADLLYGHHWFGPTFLSLIDPTNVRLINTIKVRPYWESPNGSDFPVPFFTHDGAYYVPHPDKDGRGTPLLLYLRDFTGEGVAGQFVLFDSVASGIAAGSVLGYSPRSDTAMQYTVERTQNKFNPVLTMWTDQVFDAKPSRAGNWKFTWEAGHGDWEWIDEEVHFDPVRQLFVEKVTTRPYPGFAQVRCDLDTLSLTSFLEHMQRVAPDRDGMRWLQGLIAGASPNAVGAAGLVPTFNGNQETLSVAFQLSTTGAIGIDFTADSGFAAALLAELRPWCSAN